MVNSTLLRAALPNRLRHMILLSAHRRSARLRFEEVGVLAHKRCYCLRADSTFELAVAAVRNLGPKATSYELRSHLALV